MVIMEITFLVISIPPHSADTIINNTLHQKNTAIKIMQNHIVLRQGYKDGISR